MGTTANVYIETKNEKLKFSIFMDGGYETLGIYIYFIIYSIKKILL